MKTKITIKQTEELVKKGFYFYSKAYKSSHVISYNTKTEVYDLKEEKNVSKFEIIVMFNQKLKFALEHYYNKMVTKQELISYFHSQINEKQGATTTLATLKIVENLRLKSDGVSFIFFTPPQALLELHKTSKVANYWKVTKGMTKFIFSASEKTINSKVDIHSVGDYIYCSLSELTPIKADYKTSLKDEKVYVTLLNELSQLSKKTEYAAEMQAKLLD